MALETSVTLISHLNSAWPAGGDDRSEGDNHLRNIKIALKSLITDTGLMQLGFPQKSTSVDMMLIGDGTGFAAKTAAQVRAFLDVQSTAEMGVAIPTGGIIMYKGAVDAIPGGWALCNGLNGTPNLTDKFIIGAGGFLEVGATGGASITSTPSVARTGGTALTPAQGPVHDHPPTGGASHFRGHHPTNSFGYQNSAGNPDHGEPLFTATGLSGGGQAHDHDLNHTHGNTPPYYALAFIMKL